MRKDRKQEARQYYLRNRDSIRAKASAYRAANLDKIRAKELIRTRSYGARVKRRVYELKKRYGLTPETYRDLIDSQNGLCLICSVSLRELPQRQVHVDHCHETKVVRGVLCTKCNVGIGHFKDQPDRLIRAVEYLSKHHTRKP